MKIKKTIDIEIKAFPGIIIVLAVAVMMGCLYMGGVEAINQAAKMADASLANVADAVEVADKKLPADKRIVPFSWEIEFRGDIRQITVKKDGVVVDTRQSATLDNRLTGQGIFDDVLVVMSSKPVTIFKQEK